MLRSTKFYQSSIIRFVVVFRRRDADKDALAQLSQELRGGLTKEAQARDKADHDILTVFLSQLELSRFKNCCFIDNSFRSKFFISHEFFFIRRNFGDI